MTNQTSGKGLTAKRTEDLNDLTNDNHVIELMQVIKNGDYDGFLNKWDGVNLNRKVAFQNVDFPCTGWSRAAEELSAAANYETKVLAGLPKWYDADREKPVENVPSNVKIAGKGTEAGEERVNSYLESPGSEGAKDADGKGEEKLMNASPDIYPGRTALHMAVACGQVKIVNEICHVGLVDFNIKDGFGYTPLHLACYSPHDEVIKQLLDSFSHKINANVVAEVSGYYFTALHLAVKARSKKTVSQLLGWNPKDGNYYGQFLDVDAKSQMGWTALHLAVRERQEEKVRKTKDELEKIIRLLIRFINKHSPAAVNRSDNLKSTPLHTSVEAKDYKLVEILLEEGDKIDPELLDGKGRTALEVAVHNSDYAMVQIVQQYLERARIFGNKQAYADSANAILVGAALLATLTFTAWVQIQTNDSTLFWVFSSFSFYFAIATFLSAAGAAIPSRGSTLGHVRRAVHASALCLAISLACAVAAFATAGFILVPPGIEYRRMVTATTVIGGTICFFFLVNFVHKIAKAYSAFFLWADYFRKKNIYKPVADQVKKWLPNEPPQFVKTVKTWYNENVTEGRKQSE